MSDEPRARWGEAAEPLNQAQQKILDRLGASPQDRPPADPDLAANLRAELEDGLRDAVAGDERPPLVLSKGVLEGIHGCEARFVAGDDFEWSAATARGAVAHKAIEVAITSPRERAPLDLIDEAIARFRSEEWGLGDYLARATEAEVDTIRAESNSYLAQFLETWPPLKRSWRPVTEMSIRVELLEGRVVLSGRPDLTLGRAIGQRAGKVIVDFKTGNRSPIHRADMRFYALLDALKLGTPPRLVATSYLDSGGLEVEEVKQGHLHSEVDRVVAAGRRLVELRVDPDLARRRPAAPCRWCRIAADCEEGQRYLREERELD